MEDWFNQSDKDMPYIGNAPGFLQPVTLTWKTVETSSKLIQLQFSLKAIFIVIAIVAVALALWSASGLVYLVLLLATLLLIPAFVAGIIYGRGDDRAFSVGGATATLVSIYLLREGFPTGALVGTLMWPILWIWIALSGWVSMKVRSLLLRRSETMRPGPDE